MNKNNISIQLYTTRHFKPYEPILDFFSKTGIRNIELFGLDHKFKMLETCKHKNNIINLFKIE